jgi:NAD dependent epimerase/dehydratase family enzyme
MSCVALEDVALALVHLLSVRSVRGPVNMVCTDPIRNADYTQLLGRLLRRPAIVPVPRTALQLLFGELADTVLLASQRVEPAALIASGYRFRHAGIEDALRAALGREARG